MAASRRRRKKSRVFIFGAGVSASCGLPIASGLLGRVMNRLKKEDEKTYDQINSLLEYLYPSFNVGLDNYPNIEDFMNLIEMAIEFNTEDYIASSLWSDTKLKKLRTNILQAVTDFFWNQMSECDLKPLQKFANLILQDGDVIVTFNWDVTIEHVLEAGNYFDFWYDTATDVMLLKPHGSIDWFLKKDIPPEVSQREFRKIDDGLCVYPYFNLAKYEGMKKQAPVIVPPIFNKDFTMPFFKKTWKRIYTAISGATELFFMGYSLPQEDQFARLVLSRALRNNRIRAKKKGGKRLMVSVVNPDRTTQSTFMQLIGQGGPTDFRYYEATFQAFIGSVEDGSISLLKS